MSGEVRKPLLILCCFGLISMSVAQHGDLKAKNTVNRYPQHNVLPDNQLGNNNQLPNAANRDKIQPVNDMAHQAMPVANQINIQHQAMPVANQNQNDPAHQAMPVANQNSYSKQKLVPNAVQYQNQANQPRDFVHNPVGQGLAQVNNHVEQNVPYNANAVQSNNMVNGVAAQAIAKGARRLFQAGTLADTPECSEDIERICSGKHISNNLDILTCINEKNVEDNDLSEGCHHLIWSYKLNITKNPKFELIAQQVCRQSIETISECGAPGQKKGTLLSCLLEHKTEIEIPPCKDFLRKISSIVFSDYRLVCNLLTDCKDDINHYKCGRITAASNPHENPDASHLSHTQGEVINCLEDHFGNGEKLEPNCEKQIERIAELSAEDYNLDKNMYYKCREVRDRLCDHVVAGEGRVYKCLFNHKYSPEMTHGCRDAISTRQKLVANDYKASYSLSKGCRQDMKKYCAGAVVHDSNDAKDFIGLSTMMLCLEEAKLRGELLAPKCENQLIDFRRMLMENFELSAEVVHKCAIPINQHCGGEIEKQETVHCLMGLAEAPPPVKSENEAEQQPPPLTPQCEEAIMHLIKETEVVSDYKMDTVLTSACSNVITTSCSQFPEGDPLVLSCLMEQLYSPHMNRECEKHMLELQYFISRDFFLDPIFHKRCKADAEKYCHKLPPVDGAGENPDDDGNDPSEDLATMPFNLVLSCLHRHNDEDQPKLTPVCQDEVHRILKQRALDYHLNPDLEKKCRASLGRLCSEDVPERGKELICLQDHYENITNPVCRKEIQQLTRLESEDSADLENVLISACEPMLQKYCKHVLDSEDEGKVMECLIKNKDDMESQECAAGILHFQLIEMKDYHFNYRFLKACKKDITNLCVNPQPRSKADVVMCLSKEIRNAALRTEKKSPVSGKCQEQLTVENLQMHENIELNPDVDDACRKDHQLYCSDVKAGKARILECLRSNIVSLSKDCRKKIMELQTSEAKNEDLDFTLMRTCKASIKSYCMSHLEGNNHQNIVNCLMFYKKNIDKPCRDLLYARRREMFENIDLNPELLDSCKKDIARHCSSAVRRGKQEQEDGEMPDGPVYECLKKIMADATPKKSLSPSCNTHMAEVFAEQQADFALDPQLVLKCVGPIKEHCNADRPDTVVECLKDLYLKGSLAAAKHTACAIEVAVLINAGRSDIEADPVLHQACATDIDRLCSRVQPGNGKMIQCLVTNSDSLTGTCQEEITSRQQMWQKAAVGGVANLSELSKKVLNSDNSTYLLSVIGLMAVGILFMGTICGRLTKRSMRERKMR